MNDKTSQSIDAPTVAETEALMSKLPVVDIPELRKPNDFYSYKYISLHKVLPEIGPSGDWAQFGVYKGELARFLESVLPDGRKLHLFDSFEGLPADWVGIWKAGAFRLNEQEHPVFDSEDVLVHRGWFSDSVPIFATSHNGTLSFLHIDCDLYSSTKDVLFGLNQKIEAGTIFLFDEFMMASEGEKDNGEHRALVEWCEVFDRRIEYLWRTQWMQVAVRVLQ